MEDDVSSDRSHDLYKDSGVDIEQGERLVDWLQQRDENSCGLGSIVSGIGGFAGLFQPDLSGYDKPVLVAATDGVGTKLLLAIDHGELEGIGIDLVAMCVNDLYCVGAKPLFFLDYFATGKLSDAQFKAVLSGIREGLKQCDAVLLGGETAELPGLYGAGHFDVAGFVVGVADKDLLLGPKRVSDGDIIIGLPSSGFHSNGFSLIRKLLCSHKRLNKNEIKEKLLVPTKIYFEIPTLVKELGDQLHAIANITGGGISGNLARIIPEGLVANLRRDALMTPVWMHDFLDGAELDFSDVEHIFNLGVGMVVTTAKEASEQAMASLKALGVNAQVIGEIKQAEDKSVAKVQYVDKS